MIVAMTPPPVCYVTVRSFYAEHLKNPTVTVVTDGSYAYASWYAPAGGGSGGEGLFERRNGRWCKVVNGGGSMVPNGLEQYGVARAVARRLYAKMRHARG